MKKQVLLLDVTNEEQDNKTVIKLFVKEKQKSYWVYDKNFNPYLYITDISEEFTKNKKILEEFGINKIEETNQKKFGEKILKIFFNTVQQQIDSRKKFSELNIKKFEYDINFSKRYLIDKNLEPGNFIEIEEKNNILKNLKKINKKFEAKIGSFDLETFSTNKFVIGSQPIIMAATSEEEKDGEKNEVFSYKTQKVKGIELLENEKDLIKKINEKINDFDIIITYNGDNFDFPYIKKRAKKHKQEFLINGEEIRIKRRGLDNAVELKGKQHVDAYQIMRFLQRTGSLNIIKLDLENVSEKIFGIKKEKLFPKEINDAWKNGGKELEKLIDYNKKDAQTTLKIAQQFLPLFLEISKITSEKIEDSTRNSTSQMIEDLLLKEVFKRKIIAPNKPHETEIRERINKPIIGGFVKEPIAGLHEKIVILDFASLYPSIIISHNISPETINCSHEECKKNISPDGTWFCQKEKGLFPEILEKLLKQRLKLKTEYKEKKKKGIDDNILFAKQWALKIILNSAYGYLGYARARWYSRESASAITAWARQYIKETISIAQKKDFSVLYGDSITKDRFITIKDSTGIKIKNIEEFYKEIDDLQWERKDKKLKHPKNCFALSVNKKTKKTEWKEIIAVIKHKTNKKIYRVNQKFGETIVTEDHSILTETQTGFKETKPTQINKEKLFPVKKIPMEKEFKEIDLFEIVKNYNYIKRYKDKTIICQWHTDKKFIWFGWLNKNKQIKIKRLIKVKSKSFESLCRLLGAYIAEGSSTTIKTSVKKSGASIASSNVKWLKELEKDYHTLFFNGKTCVIQSTKKERILTYNNKTIKYFDKTHKLQMMNETSAQLFSCLCGQKSIRKKLPDFIYNVPKKYKKIMLEKIIEGDGSKKVNEKLGYSEKYKKNNFRIETKSLGLISGLSLLLRQLNQNFTIRYRKEKDTHSIQTSTKFNNTIKTKITKEEYFDEVYDLSVKDNENFVDSCGQILLHNTDSTFLLMKDKTKKDVENFLEKINNKLPETMELELDGYYKRGIFVTKKEGGAAKKRYALIDEKENLKIVGFEYVRRDWCTLAKETQKKVIELVLKEGEPEKAAQLVRKTIKNLKEGKIKKEELTIITMLKRKIEDYDSIGPHVAAAQKAIKKGKNIGIGTLLSFIITKNGKTISEKAELEEFVEEGNYDENYYIKNQILPAVIKILRELNYTEEDLIQGGKQSGLKQWF